MLGTERLRRSCSVHSMAHVNQSMTQAPSVTEARSLPLRIRVSLWMLCGAALGLPVDDLVSAIDQQLAAAKRSLDGKRMRMPTAERLAHAKVMERLVGPFRDLFRWIVSPAALIRWLKRYQQRAANGDGDQTPKKPGRPWIGQEKVTAILRIYDSGLTGLSRIVGEMGKCGLPVSACRGNKTLQVLNAETGKVVASVPIGVGTDGAAFDPESAKVFVPNGDGTLTVIHEEDPATFKVVQNVTTKPGARTIAFDEQTHHVYLVTADQKPAPDGAKKGRPQFLPETFSVVIVGR